MNPQQTNPEQAPPSTQLAPEAVAPQPSVVTPAAAQPPLDQSQTVMPQMPQQQPSSAPAPAVTNDITAKKIRSSASSAFWLGVLLSILMVLILVVGATAKTPHHVLVTLLSAIELILALGLIVYGRKLKHAASALQALPSITMATLLTLGLFICGVVEFFITKKAGGLILGIVSLISCVYFFTTRSQLAKLTTRG